MAPDVFLRAATEMAYFRVTKVQSKARFQRLIILFRKKYILKYKILISG